MTKEQVRQKILDIGIIPAGYPDAGKFVVTIQALPLPDRRSADVIARALKEAIGSRLALKFEEARGNA